MIYLDSPLGLQKVAGLSEPCGHIDMYAETSERRDSDEIKFYGFGRTPR